MQRSITREVQFKDGTGKIHGFTTGTVAVKKRFKTAKGGQLLSKLNFMIDQEFTPELPIWVWVIEHPEGIFVVDTGENAQVNSPGYFAKEGFLLNRLNTTQFRFTVTPEEEIDRQLLRLGLSAEQVTQVLLTHLHLDHIDGLKHFNADKVVVNQLEWDKPNFALPSLYPPHFIPQTVSFTSTGKTGLDCGYPITQSKDLWMVAAPGHTLGHAAILVETKELSYLLAGDVTYDQEQLINEIHAGATQSFRHSRNTFKCIKQYAGAKRTIYLPSHDPDALNRISTDSFLQIDSSYS